MRVCARGGQMVMTTAGAFAAFSLMTVAVGTDYWLYSRGDCQTKSNADNDTHKNEEVLTHSGLWRTCCMEGTFIGVCKQIDHFPEESDYEQDAGEFILRAVRASSVFPILSVCLQFAGGVCVAASEFYKTKYNVILSAGILFISAGLSNIIGIIVYISAAAGDPNQSESKRSHWYGWSFYCGAFSFVATEMVGVVTIHLFIDAHRRLRAANPSAHRRALTHTNSHSSYTHNNHGCSLSRSRHPSGTRNSSYRSRYRRQPSYRSSQAAAPPTPTSTMTTLWRPPITADLPAWPLYPMGNGVVHFNSRGY
ncbi:voltage-dependent calcium channel gamma-3 subunit [Engraulis encrasicolus]|uniref:voltage-dependent calcium channel gamma-3 subunit n=1 Tax=Engraulis encrasicolus TaxID=184585 RepID=UPI002FD0044D